MSKYHVFMVGCRKDDPWYLYGMESDPVKSTVYRRGLSGDSYNSYRKPQLRLVCKQFEEVAVVEADNLEDVFALMNHWGEPELVECNDGFGVRSLSVGDIVYDVEEDLVSAVAPCGFESLEVLEVVEGKLKVK